MGPSVYDRFLATNSLNSKINLILVIIGSFSFNQSLIDIAYIYVLTSFIGTYAILKFVRDKNLD
ncbi:MAG: hypothetical protein J0H68_08090 [Sphingobacteriia bacterium]|nr:hypothetical protein [Sphingobacteriia bacterium]